MNQLNKNSDALSRVNSKYYLNCPDVGQTKQWIKEFEKLSTTDEKAILTAVLKENILDKHSHIVIKIGNKQSIDKEYSIGKKLQSIPGFIRYICKTECNDDIKKYKNINKKTTICSNNKNDPIVHLLIMSYLPLGSMRVFDWENHIDAFRSCWKQLITSLYIAFKTHGFLHIDIHLGNVLIKQTKKKSIKYSDRNIVCHGYEIVIMDFENSFVNVDTGDTTSFYIDMKRIVSDIILVLKLKFDEIDTIDDFISKRCHIPSKLDDIFQLFDIIDRMKFLGKRKPMILSYDPNVF
jgi:hypothetical protein